MGIQQPESERIAHPLHPFAIIAVIVALVLVYFCAQGIVNHFDTSEVEIPWKPPMPIPDEPEDQKPKYEFRSDPDFKIPVIDKSSIQETSSESTSDLEVEFPRKWYGYVGGFGGSELGDVGPTDEEATLLRYFKDTQQNTVTPFGKIDVESAYVRGETIYYITEDGSKFTIDTRKLPVGYHYDDAKMVFDSPDLKKGKR